MSAENTQVDVLAVFSHPDDAELTVAGTLLKLKSLGYRTGVLDVTRGEMGTRGTTEGRAEEAREAARLLGLDARLNLGQPDGHMLVTDEARRALVRVLSTRNFHWEITVNNLCMIYDTGKEQGVRCRFNFNENSPESGV